MNRESFIQVSAVYSHFNGATAYIIKDIQGVSTQLCHLRMQDAQCQYAFTKLHTVLTLLNYNKIFIIIIIIIFIIIIIIIIIIISFMQGIYTYIPETNYVLREYGVAAILLLLFMVLISLVSVLILLYFYISTFRSMCAVPNMFSVVP